MKDNQYEGPPCKHNHLTDIGKSIRYISTNVCVQCQAERQTRDKRSQSWEYKEYQAAYYQKLRNERPEKLAEYYLTQLERGNVRDTKQYKEKHRK